MICWSCSPITRSGASFFSPFCISLTLLLLPLTYSTFRLYNEMMKLRYVWRLGGQLDHSSRYSIDLGETAVDFDFGAARFVQDGGLGGLLLDEGQVSRVWVPVAPLNHGEWRNCYLCNCLMDFQATGNKRIEWPIYVLKGNGSVDVLSAGIDTARYELWPLGACTFVCRLNGQN